MMATTKLIYEYIQVGVCLVNSWSDRAFKVIPWDNINNWGIVFYMKPTDHDFIFQFCLHSNIRLGNKTCPF